MQKNTAYILVLTLWINTSYTMEPDTSFNSLKICLESKFNNLPTSNDLTALKKSYKNEVIETYNKLEREVNDKNDHRWSDLLRKSSYIDECSEILQKLLIKGINPNEPDCFGGYPLFYACTFEAIKNVALLIQHNAYMHVKSCSQTPFMAAAKEDNPELVSLLLKEGIIDINQQAESCGNIALTLAAQNRDHKEYSQQKKTIFALLQVKANPHIKNNEGHDALNIVEEKGLKDIVEMIKQLSQEIS